MERGRWLRGLVRTTITSGVVLSTIATASLALGIATGLMPASFVGTRELIAVAIRGFGAGAIAGGLFALLVSRRERDQTLSTLSTGRVALWGGLAAGSVPLLIAVAVTGPAPSIGILAAGSFLMGIGGSVLSAGMLRVARRAPRQLGELGEGGDRRLQ